ncbi:hypothetical protein BDW02DRAFT_496935, partial [Decorospora gaudefroyi]
AAFNQACLSLHEDQKTALGDIQGLRNLFEQLDSSNKKSNEDSLFRRGVKVLSPTLGVLGSSISLATPLAALDPVASNAFGIIQSVMTIAIGVCGAETQFQEQVEGMLKGIPIIERCNEIRDLRQSQNSLMFQVLVQIYKDLLDFYFEAMHILESDSFFVGLQKSRFRQKLPEIASSLAANTDQLDRLINVESYALIQKIDDDQSSIKSKYPAKVKQAEYYDSLRNRADEACKWIISSACFLEWLEDSNHGLQLSSGPSSKFCILFGDMGSGKSATASFVVDFLSSYPVFSGSLKPFVCSYYCKNDNETNKAESIYRSILSQVLKRMGSLKPRFMKWYKEAQSKNSLIDPTRDKKALRDFLVAVLQDLSGRLYLVLDGVDECDYENREHLLDFFEQFHEHRAPVHVFLSSRYDESLEERLPPGRRILRMEASLDRDYTIAAFHVNRFFKQRPEELKEVIISELAAQAEGSAIWLTMVLEYLRRPHREEEQIKRLLKHMPSPKSMSELYRKLLESATRENSEDEPIVECALETLAISGRLLTLDELRCAVTLRMEEENISCLSDLEACGLSSTGLQELINPFVSFAGHAGSPTVRLVHQSLKDLILSEALPDWGRDDSLKRVNTRQRQARLEQRQAKLHSSLLSCCIKYLLLDDLQEKDLFPEEHITLTASIDLGFFGSYNMDSDDHETNESRSASSQSRKRDLDPEQAGLGKFFTYAACYWTEHFKQCSSDALPNADDISKLCRHGSLILRNWMETYKRPSLTLSIQRHLNVEAYDELVASARFGSHAFLAKFLERRFDDKYIRKESPVEAVGWLTHFGDITGVKIMLQNESLGSKLRNGFFMCEMIATWKDSEALEKQATQLAWKEVFQILVRDYFDGDDSSSYDWANAILCLAARRGCLTLVEILFERASQEPRLAEALLQETPKESPYQSVGEAAFWDQPHVVRYLLTQTHVDISAHLHHRTSIDHRNVLHCAVRSNNPEIIRLLIKKHPSGVHEKTDSGDTPLQILAFNSAAKVDAVRALVEDGKADVNLGGGWYSPLRTAIRQKNVDVCRLLASHGAQVDDAITVDAETGLCRLSDGLEDVEAERRILEVLASASPRTVIL